MALVAALGALLRPLRMWWLRRGPGARKAWGSAFCVSRLPHCSMCRRPWLLCDAPAGGCFLGSRTSSTTASVTSHGASSAGGFSNTHTSTCMGPVCLAASPKQVQRVQRWPPAACKPCVIQLTLNECRLTGRHRRLLPLHPSTTLHHSDRQVVVPYDARFRGCYNDKITQARQGRGFDFRAVRIKVTTTVTALTAHLSCTRPHKRLHQLCTRFLSL